MRSAKQKEMSEISDLRRMEILHLRSNCPWGGWGGYSYIFIHTQARAIFFIKNFEFQYSWGFSENWIFWWYEDFVNIFLGSSQNYLEVISMHFRVISEGQGTEWRIFFGLLKCQIFIWGAWNSWYFFLMNGRCWARAYIQKNGVCPSVQTYHYKCI